jgi:hypothetical protein
MIYFPVKNHFGGSLHEKKINSLSGPDSADMHFFRVQKGHPGCAVWPGRNANGNIFQGDRS